MTEGTQMAQLACVCVYCAQYNALLLCERIYAGVRRGDRIVREYRNEQERTCQENVQGKVAEY